MTETPVLGAAHGGFMFLCDHATESECLQKQLVGTTQLNALWCMNIKAGDDIYLFNFSSGLLRGPYLAVSGADCHEPAAWGGKFPIQVRVSKTPLTRQVHSSSANAPVILKKKRPSGELGEATRELFVWIQQSGLQVD